jgi:hypothetical protein
MRIHRELNLAFSAPTLVRDLERRDFLPDFRVSPRIPPEQTSPTNPAPPLAPRTRAPRQAEIFR